jgi:hypothetical protein
VTPDEIMYNLIKVLWLLHLISIPASLFYVEVTRKRGNKSPTFREEDKYE